MPPLLTAATFYILNLCIFIPTLNQNYNFHNESIQSNRIIIMRVCDKPYNFWELQNKLNWPTVSLGKRLVMIEQ